MSEWPIWSKISLDVNQCDCCGKTRLKRTVHLFNEDIGDIYLGVTCAGNWFGLNMSGNPYKAANKLGRHLKTVHDEQLDKIFEDIHASIEENKLKNN